MQISPKILAWRSYIQCFVLFAVILLPVAHFNGFINIRGNFYTWHIFGVPFADPLNAIQSLLQGVVHGFWPISTLIVGAILSLLVALLLGRVFCSWLCPYGFLSELNWKLYASQNKAKSKFHNWKWRISFVIVGLLLGVFWGVPMLNQFSAPGLISLAPQEFWQTVLPSLGFTHSDATAVSVPPHVAATTSPMMALTKMLLLMLGPVLFILVLEHMLKKRVWCAYVCPQALLLMLAARLGRMSKNPLPAWQINWSGEHCICKGERPCAKSCSLGINPRTLRKNVAGYDACINCAACVLACAHVHRKSTEPNALSLQNMPKQ